MLRVDHDYYVVELVKSLPNIVMDWMCETYGKPDGTRWFYRSNKIYFADQKDHLMFVIKWS